MPVEPTPPCITLRPRLISRTMTNRHVSSPERSARVGAAQETAARIHVLPDYTVPVGGARDATGYVPISDYAFLSDCRSAALVASDGSVDWLCWPRFDSSALFARVLDSGGGRFVFAPTHAYTVERRYVERTNALQTTFRPAAGTVRLDDWLHTPARGERSAASQRASTERSSS